MKITQDTLGQILGVSGKSTVSNYLNEYHDSLPDIIMLYNLKQKFGISIDALCDEIYDKSLNYITINNDESNYEKFVGVYSLYYLTTSKISSSFNQYSEESTLAYGVLAIVKDETSSSYNPKYKAYACFSFKEEEKANDLRKQIENIIPRKKHLLVKNCFIGNDRFCEGEFELIQNESNFAISMTGYSNDEKSNKKTLNDKILIMGFNPNSTSKAKYIGGATLSSSLSRGMEKSPCSQIIIISRPMLLNEKQLISSELIKLRQEIITPNATDNIMKRYHELEKNDNYTIEDKDILMRHHINYHFKLELEKSYFQLFYLLKQKDKDIYKFIKNFL